jgi:hypothetical protein
VKQSAVTSRKALILPTYHVPRSRLPR